MANLLPGVVGDRGIVRMMSIGFLAGILTSIAALPQVVKTIKTGSTRDLSLWQPALLSVGVALWLVYGLQIGDVPLVVMNILPLGANIALTAMKLRENRTCQS